MISFLTPFSISANGITIWSVSKAKNSMKLLVISFYILQATLSENTISSALKIDPRHNQFLLPLLVHFYWSHIISPLVSQWFSYMSAFFLSCCSVIKLCLTFCNPTVCSILDFLVLHCLLGFVQTPVHCVNNTI